MRTYSVSDKGKVRLHNEDSVGIYVNKQNQVLAIVADGMGGHKAGDVASSMAIAFLGEKWEESELILSPKEAEQWLRTYINQANDIIYQYAQTHEECKGMGTTIVMTICTNSFVSIAHVGDSRCYGLMGEYFSQITEDHSLVNELVRGGHITPEDAEFHPRKNVLLRAVGTEETVDIDIRTLEWEQGDILLLCSDGLSNKLPIDDLKRFMSTAISLEEKGHQMVTKANELGGEDNITLVIIDYDKVSG